MLFNQPDDSVTTVQTFYLHIVLFSHVPFFVARYEVKFQNGQDCGGAYIKLLTKSNKLSLVSGILYTQQQLHAITMHHVFKWKKCRHSMYLLCYRVTLETSLLTQLCLDLTNVAMMINCTLSSVISIPRLECMR